MTCCNKLTSDYYKILSSYLFLHFLPQARNLTRGNAVVKRNMMGIRTIYLEVTLSVSLALNVKLDIPFKVYLPLNQRCFLSRTLGRRNECSCNRIGSYSNACDKHGQCRCLPGVGGKKCDHCVSGFWGLHLIAQGALGCQPCGCSAFGSSRFDCEQSSGRCQCKPDSYGVKCDSCGSDSILTSNGCSKKTEFHVPKDCNELRCHHGAVCVIALSGTPVCKCSKQCSLDHLGVVAEMTVCGSDNNTYGNICELQQFACIHQLDLVPSVLGICPKGVLYHHCIIMIDRFHALKFIIIVCGTDDDNNDISNDDSETQRRRGRKLDVTPILGNLCVDNTDCPIFNAYCGELNFSRLKSCKCREGFFPSKDLTYCIQG
uniref:EGF-like domain-containing protein n=1 Tax=Loa loa TaxID=7209 RepID=A0A1I7VLW1_LOALO